MGYSIFKNLGFWLVKRLFSLNQARFQQDLQWKINNYLKMKFRNKTFFLNYFLGNQITTFLEKLWNTLCVWAFLQAYIDGKKFSNNIRLYLLSC